MHKKPYGCNECPYLINLAKITQNLSLIKCAMRVHVRVYQIHKKICSETFQPLVQMQLTKRRKNSIFTFVIRLGGVAQLVERLNGIQEVRGSTPLISTTAEKNEPDYCRVLFLFGGSARRCRAACGVNPFGLTASEERSKRLHLRKSSVADIANDCAICRTNA